MAATAEFRLLAASGLLGYGYPAASLEAGIERKPDMIGVDGGSTDPGPYYLGSGQPLNTRRSMKRDLALMLHAALKNKIPLVIGTCGGSGAEPHLQATVEIAREIAREGGLHFRMAIIHAEQDKGALKRRLREGRIAPLRHVPPLDEQTIDRAAHVVGMMGPEPFARALDEGAQVILAGRSSDPAPWAACAMRAGHAPAPAWLAGKYLECGASSASPKGFDCLLTTVREDYVVLEPTNPDRRCTPYSVALQTLHENATPTKHIEPGGILDLTDCRFEALSERAVKVSGMRWQSMPYTVKLEGAELVGYRAVTMCGTHDPVLIENFDTFIASVRTIVEQKALAMEIESRQYQLFFHVYGRDGVMGRREPRAKTSSHELGIFVEVVGESQEIASAVLAIARANLLHLDFPGRLCKSGNMAIPLSPSDLVTGPSFRFSVFHVITPNDPYELFPIEYESV